VKSARGWAYQLPHRSAIVRVFEQHGRRTKARISIGVVDAGLLTGLKMAILEMLWRVGSASPRASLNRLP
jgi:hypothetical protein